MDALNRLSLTVSGVAPYLLIALTGRETGDKSGLRRHDILARKECALAATRMLKKLAERPGKELQAVRDGIWSALLLALLDMYPDSRTQPYADQVVATVRDLLGAQDFVPLFVEALCTCNTFGDFHKFHWSLWRQIRQTIVDAQEAYFASKAAGWSPNGSTEEHLRSNNCSAKARENLVKVLGVVQKKLMNHQAIRRNIFEVILSRVVDHANVDIEVVDQALSALTAHYNESVHYMIGSHTFASAIVRPHLSVTTDAADNTDTTAQASSAGKPLTPSSQPASPLAHAAESMMTAQLSTLKRRVCSARLSTSAKSTPATNTPKSAMDARRRHNVQATGRSIALKVSREQEGAVYNPTAVASPSISEIGQVASSANANAPRGSYTYKSSEEFIGLRVDDPAGFAAKAAAKLRDNCEWTEQFEGLTMVRRVALNHADEVSIGQWSEVVKRTLAFFESLRSSLCKQSLLCMDDLINALPRRCIDSQLERIIPALLKKSADTSAFVVDAAATAMHSAIARLSQQRICSILLNIGASHSNPNLRAKAAQFLLVLVGKARDGKEWIELSEQVKKVVEQKLLHDNASATRSAAKKILSALAGNNGAGLPATSQRRIKRKPSSSQSGRQEGGKERMKLPTEDVEAVREWVVALDSSDWRVRKETLQRLAVVMEQKKELEWGRERTVVLDAFAERVNDSNLKVKAAALEHLSSVLRSIAITLDAPILLILLEALMNVRCIALLHSIILDEYVS